MDEAHQPPANQNFRPQLWGNRADRCPASFSHFPEIRRHLKLCAPRLALSWLVDCALDILLSPPIYQASLQHSKPLPPPPPAPAALSYFCYLATWYSGAWSNRVSKGYHFSVRHHRDGFPRHTALLRHHAWISELIIIKQEQYPSVSSHLHSSTAVLQALPHPLSGLTQAAVLQNTVCSLQSAVCRVTMVANPHPATLPTKYLPAIAPYPAKQEPDNRAGP